MSDKRPDQERKLNVAREPQSTGSGSVANRQNAESSIMPALMANPWLMTNAFLSNPFGFARAMTNEMDRIFAGDPADVRPYSGPTSDRTSSNSTVDTNRGRSMSHWSPQIEVRHNDKQLTVCADLPGMSAKDIDIQVDNGILTVSGERHQSSEDKKEGFYRSERSYGSFSRSIALPEGVDENQIRAKFDNGVLEVSVPIPEQRQRGRKVEIQSGG